MDGEGGWPVEDSSSGNQMAPTLNNPPHPRNHTSRMSRTHGTKSAEACYQSGRAYTVATTPKLGLFKTIATFKGISWQKSAETEMKQTGTDAKYSLREVSKDKKELLMILQDARENGHVRITFAEERHIDKAAIQKEEETKQRIKVAKEAQPTGSVDRLQRDSTNAIRLSASWNRLPDGSKTAACSRVFESRNFFNQAKALRGI
eukprot:896110-Rhodomonas_salina.1